MSKRKGSFNLMEKVLFDQDTISRSLKRIAHEILEKNDDLNNIVIIGIRTRGAYLAQRLVNLIEVFEGVNVPLGELDITKYRDDITREMKEVIVNQSTVPMTLNGKTVILVDDVLYTGRTIRAALEAMACKKPTIVAGNEGYIGLFDEDKLEVGISTNFCCRGCDEPSEKELIQDIANFFGLCDEEWVRLGEYARKTVIENYSVKRMADDAESVYAKVIK